MKKLLTTLVVALAALTVSSCGGTDTPPPPGSTLTATPDKLEIAGTGGTGTFEVKSNAIWLAESNQSGAP